MNAKLFGIFGLLIVLCVLGAIGNPQFLTPNNIENLVSRTSMYGILGIGVAFVIITGGIDLSIGSVVALSGCLLAILLQVDYQAFGSAEVVRVSIAEQQVVIRATDELTIQTGEQLYHDRGRQVFTVVGIEAGTDTDAEGNRLEVQRLRVEPAPSRAISEGRVAKVQRLTSFERDGKNVQIAGEHPYLSPRDKMLLVQTRGSGLNRLTVEDVRSSASGTEIQLASVLAAPKQITTSDWVAVFEERRQRMPVMAALGLVLLVAAFLGLVHGLLVTKLKVQSFVVTLCGLLIYRGISRWLVSDQPVGFGNEFEQTLSKVGSGKWGLYELPQGVDVGIPYPFFILLGVAVVAAVFLNMTIWGRYMLALGRNEEAARYSGINTGRMTILAYVISTCLAAVGGILFALDSNSISPSSFGNSFELYAIAAAVLGGCSLRGGEGTISGVIIGTAVVRVLNNLIILMKISDTLEFAIIGLVILLGVIADELIKRFAAARRRRAQAKT